MSVETIAAEGRTLNTYEQDKAGLMVALTLTAQPYLEGVNQMLEDADEPMPAIGGVLDTVPGTDLPRVFLGYGQTEPGQGIQPVINMRAGTEGGRIFKYGLTLPMDRATQRSVTFFPHEDGQPSPASGWWQQWRPDQASIHRPGETVDTLEYPDGDIAFNSAPFSTWPIPDMPDIPSTSIIANPNHAQSAVGNVLYHVRGEAQRGQALGFDAGARRRLIVVGGEAVQAAINALREQPEQSHLTPVPEPLVDMLDTVAADLHLARGPL